ncbi:hypothetical protein ACLB2K_062411 [Fragaria x ananassa]
MFCATKASVYLMNMNTSVPSSRGFSSVVKSLKYAKSHEWARVDGKSATIGCGTVESVQASKGLHSSLSGNVVEVNEKLRTIAVLVNASPYEDGWIMKVEMSNKEELSNLMDYDEYVSYVENKFPNIDEPVANT